MSEPTFALVGSETLLGREIRDLAATAPALALRLIAADEEQAGTLTRVGEEPIVVTDLTPGSLAGARGVFLAGSPASGRKALELVGGSGTAVIDLTYAVEDQPEMRLRAPAIEAAPEPADVSMVAHPAAIALALFLRRLHASETVRRSVVQIMAPASEQGAAGVEELQQQTVSLLSFRGLPRAVFDAQLGFNLLARYGEEAPAGLEDSELRIERHLATLLALPGEGAGVPMPSLRLIQAPVFHGYSISAWAELGGDPGVESLESSLALDTIDVRSGDFEPPTNVGQAGHGGIAVGAIAPDRNARNAYWFWLVADNLRVAAENAVAAARQLL